MLGRSDGGRLPLGLIPNGSGNTVCFSLGIYDLPTALDYIEQGYCASFDIYRVLPDRETAPKKEDFSNCRYALMSCFLGYPPEWARAAVPFKPYLRDKAYILAIVKTAVCEGFVKHQFEVELDGKLIDSQASSIYCGMNNTKYSGKDIMWPFSSPTDGLLTMGWNQSDFKIKNFCSIQNRQTAGISEAYENNEKIYRGKKLKIMYKGKNGETPIGDVPIHIDGEVWEC